MPDYRRDFVVYDAPDAGSAMSAVIGQVHDSPFLPKSVTMEKVAVKPHYGSLWRLLLRRPAYYEVTATFTIQPAADEPVVVKHV